MALSITKEQPPPPYPLVASANRPATPASHVRPPVACKLCNDLKKWNEDDPRLAFDFRPEELVRSAYEGRCDSCIVILEGLRQSETSDWSFQRDVRRVYAKCCSKRGNGTESLGLEVYFSDDRPKMELEFYGLQPHAWKAILPRASVSGHPLSPGALAWVRSLMADCTSNHDPCNSHGTPQLPKRVLKLDRKGSGPISVRLFEPDGEFDTYIALSHCWGQEQTCITTRATLVIRKQGIPWDTIPRTFQDVMRFALKLRIRYIWIDSLCILQDDEVDWQIESSKMADIYQYAALTLAATASTGDSQGCFPAPSTTVPDVELTLPDDVGTCSIAVRRPIKHWDNVNQCHLKKHFPLLARGWAFQERILSPRILHFCESELVWECREISICECGGLTQDTSPGEAFYDVIQDSGEESREFTLVEQARLDQILARQLQEQEDLELAIRLQSEEEFEQYELSSEESNGPATPIGNSADIDPWIGPADGQRISHLPSHDTALPSKREVHQQEKLITHFHRLVEQYSALGLTKQTDRLPAFSGLCKRIRHLRGDYLAGLWSESLCFDLLWRVDKLNLDASTSGRPPEYPGPSWSWVSVESPVSYWTDITDFEDPHNLAPQPEDAHDDFLPVYDLEQETKPLGRNTGSITVQIDLPGHNPFGRVTAAAITAEASSRAATLLYTYDSYWYGRTNKHDPMRYKLRIGTQYEMPFFADYVLSLDGPHRVAEGEALTLLLVHPKICLVLRRKKCDGGGVEQQQLVWERIGIARISEDMLNYYAVDWMRTSRVRRFRIV